MTAALRLRVLGELTASLSGTRVDLGGRRQRAVLAALVVSRGEAVSAERVAEAVWGDEPPANATGALQSYVSHLRRALEPGADARSRDGVLASSGRGYVLRLPDDAVDAWHFEALLQSAVNADPAAAVPLLTEALQLWAGPAYADYAGEPWVETEVARLTEMRDVARERLAEARLATGHAALLVPELEALVREQPLREQRWRLLVLALYRSQRQADALAALRRARATLADELGVDPGPALRALESEVLQQSPALDVPVQRSAAAGRPATLPHTVPSDLVGRERELEVITQVVTRAAGGASGLLVIEGAAGIGKTRLLAEAGSIATAHGMRVLSARASQLERMFAFGVARQLFEPSLTDDAARGRLLGGAAASARGLFDEVVSERADGSFAVLHGLYWLTVNLTADAPVVLAVDDVHWSDAGSLRFLGYLVRRLEDLPVLLVVTLRAGERGDDEDLLTELALHQLTTSLRPSTLGPAEVTELVRRRLGEPDRIFSTACHSTTGGNPLLLRQLLRALEAQNVRPDVAHADTVRAVGSRAISSLVLMRLRRMRPDVATTARALAVLGDGAELPHVAALAGMAEDACAAALAALTRAEVLRDEARLGFVHTLVRDAVYGDVPAPERGLQHERAARVLQQSGGSPEQVAAHLVLAPRRGDRATVAVLRAAARTAAERGAPDSGVTLLRRALEEPPAGRERVEVLLELGLLEVLVDGPAGVARLAQAYPLLDDAVQRADVAVVLARTNIFTAPPGVATAFAREAAAALPAELADHRQALLALRRAAGYMQAMDPAQYRDGPAPAVAGDGDGARMLAAVLSFEHLIAGQDRQRTMELGRFALEGDRLLDVDHGLFWVMAAGSLVLADDDIGDFWERARAHAHRTGAVFAALSANLWRGWTEWLHGDLQEAAQSIADSTEQQRMWRGVVGHTHIAAFSSGVHLDRGDVAAARAALDAAAPYDIGGEGSRLFSTASARVLVEEGRPREALAVLDRARDPLFVNPAYAPWRSIQARALLALDQPVEARDLVEEEVRLLRVWGAPGSLGPSLRLLGELSGPAGVEHLREAERLLASSRAAVELARVRVSLGRAPELPDDEAVPLLEQAAVAAATRGAAGVLRDATAALRARGRSTDLDCPVTTGLTRTQRRAVDLAAEGLDEREIAQRLLLTPGAVRTTLQQAAVHVDD